MALVSDSSPSEGYWVNECVHVRQEGEIFVVMAGGIAVHSYHAMDEAGAAFAMVLLVRSGLAKVTEVARAFGCSRVTVYRAKARYECGGISALGRGKAGPKGPYRLDEEMMQQVLLLKRQGVGNRVIAARFGVSERGVRHALERCGYRSSGAVQGRLPGFEHGQAATAPAPRAETTADTEAVSETAADTEAVSETAADTEAVSETAADTEAVSEEAVSETATGAGADRASEAAPAAQVALLGDPWDRTLDRLLAPLGLLEDANPQFGSCERVPRAGVLLAVPALCASGIFDVAAEVYRTLGAAFYGVRTTFMTLSLMALLRVKHAERLRHTSPPMLGRLLGLDRAPEVKTLRQKVRALAARQQSEVFLEKLAQRRVAAHSEAMGFLYVDGHVRVYNGKHPLPKAHVSRLRLSMPATVDHWVNDRDGDPVFVVTATKTNSLAHELPVVLEQIRQLVGDRRVTVVFDRGGWSPKLFALMIDDGFDVLTYRKGKFPQARKSSFELYEAQFDGRKVRYLLAERTARWTVPGKRETEKAALKGKSTKKKKKKKKKKTRPLKLREVIRLSDNGEHQTSIVTNRTDLSAVEVAYRMFERWRQENFFKYMGEHYALDALVAYGTEPGDNNRTVPNPKRKAANKKLTAARAELANLEREYGAAAADNEEAQRPTMRGFKIANGEIGKALREARANVEHLEAEARKFPIRVTAIEAAGGEPVVRLKTDAKRLTDAVKMVAYQAETSLLRLISPYYKRAEDEGRTLVTSALNLSGDYEVTPDELHVILDPAASANRTKALAQLCHDLNATDTAFPGTSLRLRYSIRGVQGP